MLRYIAFIACTLFFTSLKAQNFSYIYIQGDKITPFYVKYEDEMLTRFGKNYYIISELAPGPINLQVLFQQNVFPPQKFTINVPENGFRGFLMVQKNGAFSLYDLHRRFYIPAGNQASEDDYAAYDAGTITVPADDITPESTQVEVEKPKPDITAGPDKKPVTKTKTTPAPKSPKPRVAVAKTAEPDEPVFMDNVELRGGNPGGTLPAGGVVKNSVAIINSDCPKAISNASFDNIYKKASSRSSTAKLKYLLEELDDKCFTSNQVRQLTQTLSGDDERYTFLKRAYARVTDQSAFARLESLLSTDEWKGYFRSIL